MPVTSTEPKFNCSNCGKEYRWKPELAGKKAKCKCGGVIAVPTQPLAAARSAPRPAAQEADLDGLYALAQEEKKAVRSGAVADESAGGYRCPSCSTTMPPGAVVCPSCGLDMRTGVRPPAVAGARGGTAIAAAGAYLTATATGRGGAGVLPYGGGGGGAASNAERAAKDILWEGGKARSLYLPIGLIVLGLLFYFGQVAFSNNKVTAGMMVALVFARVILDSVLIFLSMLIAVRGFDMGFGAFGPGILKILAVAMGPGALGQMVEEMVGGGFGGLIVGFLVTIILYATLIKVLFNLDLGETLLLIFLIYAVRRILGNFLIVALIGMSSSGALSPGGAGAIGAGTVAVVTAGDDDEHVPPKRTMDPEEIAGDLDTGGQRTLNYNKGGTEPANYFDLDVKQNRFTNMDRAKSVALVKALNDAGAKSVTCVDFQDIENEAGEKVTLVGGIVVELPQDPAARKKIFEIRADLLKSIGQQEVMVEIEAGGKFDEKHKQEPLKDWGQKFMVFHFGYDKVSKDFAEARWEKRQKEMEAQRKAEEAEEAKNGEGDKPAATDAPAEGKKPDASSADDADDDAAPF